LKIVGAKMRHMDADLAKRDYFDLEERFGKSVFDVTAGFMQSGPVIALVLVRQPGFVMLMAGDESGPVRAARRVDGHGGGRRMIIDDLWRQSNIVRRPLGTA
jgi:hypothetical protein